MSKPAVDIHIIDFINHINNRQLFYLVMSIYVKSSNSRIKINIWFL